MRALRPRALALALILAPAACGGRPAPDDPARGAVVFLVDTLRADHLSCYGYGRETSPHLDALARYGVLFEECLAQSSWTKPATASVMTGLYPGQHGANKEAAVMPDEVVTLAERLFEAGIRTAGFYGNSWLGPRHALGQGFEIWEHFQRDDPERSARIVDRALAYLDGLGDERFFLYLHVVDPHAPYAPPTDPLGIQRARFAYDEDAARKQADLNLGRISKEELAHLVALYDTEIAYADAQFGRLLQGLRDRGLYEETLILFLADHGEEFGDHGSWRHNPGLYREVVRVPLVARFPRPTAAERGARHPGLVGQIDVAPTVLAAFGLALPADLPGGDLRALARSMASGNANPRDAFLISEADAGGVSRRAVVGRGRKYIRAWSPYPAEFLFDLAADPGETTDLLAADPGLADEHRAVLERHLAATNTGFFLLLQNGGEEEVEAELRLLTSAAPPRVTPLYTEDIAGGQREHDRNPVTSEVELDGRRLSETVVVVYVAPGDGDGLRFEPAAADEPIAVSVHVGGSPIAPEQLLLGAAGEPARNLPYSVSPADASRLAAPLFAARTEDTGFLLRARLWAGPTPSTPDIEFTAEEFADFQALGYMGEE